ncbi:MAG: hypothetical protein EOM29_10100 [Bacteroidia bacterium]|jgi:hypothetical protein|nr:hypothetical protein [Bacteroidia bacterium]
MEIKYNFDDIRQNQFAVFPDKLEDNSKLELSAQFEVSSNLTIHSDISNLRCIVHLELKQKKDIILLIEVETYFSLTKDSWDKIEDNKYKLPADFIRHLALLSFSTVRGIVYSKTQDSESRKIILPSIDVNQIVKNDYIVEE